MGFIISLVIRPNQWHFPQPCRGSLEAKHYGLSDATNEHQRLQKKCAHQCSWTALVALICKLVSTFVVWLPDSYSDCCHPNLHQLILSLKLDHQAEEQPWKGGATGARRSWKSSFDSFSGPPYKCMDLSIRISGPLEVWFVVVILPSFTHFRIANFDTSPRSSSCSFSCWELKTPVAREFEPQEYGCWAGSSCRTRLGTLTMDFFID